MAETITARGAIPFPFDPVRTAIVQMFMEPGMISDRVLPPAPRIGKSEFKWFRYKIDDAFIVPDTRLGRKSEPTEVEFEGEEVVDQTDHYGLRDSVPLEDTDAAGAASGSSAEWADPADTAVMYLTHLLKLDRELRVASLVFDTDQYGEGYKTALGAEDKFSAADSNPLETLEDALTTPIFRPNVLVFGQEPWSKFRMHKHVLAATNKQSGAESGMASRQAVAELLEVDEVLVGRSRVARTREGQALELKRAWGKSVACLYRGAFAGSSAPGGVAGSERQEGMAPMISDARRPTFGFTAVYQPLEARSRFNEGKGIKGVNEVLVRESCKEVISGGNGFGYLISEAVG